VQLTLPLVKVQLFSEEIFSGTCCDISLLFVVNFFLIEIRTVFFVSPSLYLLIYSLTYLLTYLLNPWSIVLLEKLTGSQLIKKYTTFYGTRRFITAFTRASHLSLS